MRKVEVVGQPPVEMRFSAGSIEFSIESLGNLAARVADVRTEFDRLLQARADAAL